MCVNRYFCNYVLTFPCIVLQKCVKILCMCVHRYRCIYACEDTIIVFPLSREKKYTVDVYKETFNESVSETTNFYPNIPILNVHRLK